MLLPCNMLWAIILSILLCGQNGVNADDSSSSEGDKRSVGSDFGEKGGFVFFMPREVLSGENVNACVTLHNVDLLPKEVAVHLEILGETYVTKQIVESDYSCFELMIPSVHSKTTPFYINVAVTIAGMSINKMDQDPVRFYPKQDTLFLQTDKQKYRPGETIRIRLLLLNVYLQPGYSDKVEVITLKNPAGTLEALWEDQPVQLGLAHLEYKLSERALEGDWIIEANKIKKVITVIKLVKPRFEVYVNSTNYIDVYTDAYYYTVCGMYFFGRPVKGTASIKLRIEPSLLEFQQRKETENGCVDFTIPAADFSIAKITSDHTRYYNADVKLEASIEEAGTGLNVTVTREIRMKHIPFHLRIDLPGVFRPGFPISGTVEMIDFYNKYDMEKVMICYNMIIDGYYQEIKPCSHNTFDGNRKIYFTIPPVSSEIQSIYVTVESGSCGASYGVYMYRVHSPSNTYLYIKQNKNDELKCGEPQHFTIFYTANELSDQLTFYYTVKSADNLLIFNKIVPASTAPSQRITPKSLINNTIEGQHKYTKFGVNVKMFSIQFELDLNVLSGYELLVYTVLTSGEVVADSKQVKLEPCLRNKVALTWSEDSYKPGEYTKAVLKTAPGSFCSLIAPNANNDFDFRSFNIEKLLNKRKGVKPYRELHSVRDTCIKPETNEDGIVMESDDKDPQQIFKDFGGALVTNLKVITKPCKVHRYTRRQHRPKRAVATNGASTSGVTNERSLWLDTWLWDLVQTDDNGTAEFTKQLPHDTTRWATNAVCISQEEGIGLSEIHNLTVLKPFFVDVIAPHSIKRGNSEKLYVKIFNFHNESVAVKLQIHGNNKIHLSSEDIATTTIQSGDNGDYSFDINAVSSGTAIITVAAEAVGKDRDVVFKDILIEPEGYALEEVRTEVLCSNGVLPKSVTWKIELSENAIVNVNRSEVILNGRRLGFKLEDIGEELLQEADDLNEILLRDWYILRYLEFAPRENASSFTNYIQQAYSKILKFRNENGSFSKFRSSKAVTKPSLFLTAFAIKNLVQSKRYSNVDETIIKEAAKWIYDQQLENGCFDADDASDSFYFLPVFNAQESSLHKNGAATLTSYIISNLLEAGVEIPSSVIESFKQCFFGYIKNNTDQYVRAISTYALLLSDPADKAVSCHLVDMVAQLPTNAEIAEVPTRRETEIVAYILLSLHYQNDTAYSDYVREAVTLLRRYFAAKGLFDLAEVVTADALSKYGIVAGFENDVKIQVSVGEQNEEITIHEEDHLKMHRMSLKEFGGVVSLNISGVGCVYAKVVIEYNTPSLIQQPPYLLNVSTELDTLRNYCARKIIPCVALGGSYVYSYKTVVEVNLPKGFDGVANSVYHLYEESKKVIESREIDGKVYVDLKEMTNEEVCTPFTIIQTEKNSTYSGSINVYDFYNHALITNAVFHVAACGTHTAPS